MHTLKHCYATNLIENGASLLQVKELMGYSNIISTMEYIHVAKLPNNEKIKWVKARKKEVLNIKYYHIVFTIPSEIYTKIKENIEFTM